MSDVFISYARPTTAEAQRIAEALAAQGFSVWRDDQLPAHRSYVEVIEERLQKSKAVVVLWSAPAARSQWVQSEADRARVDGKLVQVTLDGAPVPMPFDRIQCADLSGWTGDPQAAEWLKVSDSIRELLGTRPAGSPQPVAEAAPAEARMGSAEKPSIAVLPFANLSNDPEQQYFTDGMVEEITTALSRFKSIVVMGAGSRIVMDGRTTAPLDAARRVGVRYLLEGSVRKAAARVRIMVNLIDVESGARVWSDRFEDTLDDVFSLQDAVAQHVAGVIEPTLHDVDVRRVFAHPTEHSDAYDLYLRADTFFRSFTRAETLLAIDLLDRVIKLDPDYALALSHSAVCHRQVLDYAWADDLDAVRRRGLEMAERALAVGGLDERVLAHVAVSLPGLEGRMDRGLALIERAKTINPASSFVWLIAGTLHIRAGDPDLARQDLAESIRLDPLSRTSELSRMYDATALFQLGRLEESLALFRSTSGRLPISHAVLAAILGHLGELDAGRAELARFRAHSAASIDQLAAIWFHRPAHRRLFSEGIDRLGAPVG
jgi:TolB-like protein